MSLLCAALLATLVAAGEVDKESSSQSLLLFDSSIHEADHICHDGHQRSHDGHHGCSSSRTELLAQRSQYQMTLLQVAAKTGEVAQYLPRDNDEEAPASRPASRKVASDKKEKNHAINSLLARGSGAQEPEGEEETESRSRSGRSKSNVTEEEEKEEKPKRRIVIDEERLEKSKENNNNDDKKVDKDNNDNDDKAKHESADLDRSADKEALDDVPQGARIAPFGKEDTARELQHHAARTQDTLVDALENAEVAEIKRSIFRSLTRLRAAEIKEFDTIARLETQAIDEYNDNHHYRSENPLDYTHSAEVKVKDDKFTSFHD